MEKLFIIILCGAVILILPLAAIVNKDQNAAITDLQAAVTEFTNDVCQTKVLTKDKKAKFEAKVQQITGTEMEFTYEIKQLGENYAKKADVETDQTIGEAKYVIVSEKDIDEELNARSELLLEQGWTLYVSAGNSGETALDRENREVYKTSGSASDTMFAEASGIVKGN